MRLTGDAGCRSSTGSKMRLEPSVSCSRSGGGLFENCRCLRTHRFSPRVRAAQARLGPHLCSFASRPSYLLCMSNVPTIQGIGRSGRHPCSMEMSFRLDSPIVGHTGVRNARSSQQCHRATLLDPVSYCIVLQPSTVGMSS